MMAAPGRSGPPLGTAFTVSIEARHGVTTGISAADRAHTIRVAVEPRLQARRPRHARATSSRCARAAAACSCAPVRPRARSTSRASPGLTPAGVICEIMNDDGTMARMPDLERLRAEARPPHRHRRRPHPVPPADRAPRAPRRPSSRCALDATGTEWTRHRLRVLDRRAAVPRAREGRRRRRTSPSSAAMHSGSILGDVFALDPASTAGANLREAIRRDRGERARRHRLPPAAQAPAAEIASSTRSRRGRSRARRAAAAPARQPAPRVRPRRAGPRRSRAAQDPPAHEQPA